MIRDLEISNIVSKVHQLGVRIGLSKVPGAGIAFRYIAGHISGIDYTEYEPYAAYWIRHNVEKGDTVIDIGASQGEHTINFAKCVGGSGRVFAFEPLPENITILSERIKEEGVENVTVIERAVGSSNQTSRLYVEPGEARTPSVVADHDDSETVDIQLIELESYFQQKGIKQIDTAKIDIEGGEFDVLCNTNALDYFDTLLCELHPHLISYKKIEEVIDELNKSGELRDLQGEPIKTGGIRRNRPSRVIWESN